MADQTKPQTFALVVQAEPGCTAPAVVRLRTLLKVLKRRFGFRCLTVREVDPAAENREPGAGPS